MRLGYSIEELKQVKKSYKASMRPRRMRLGYFAHHVEHAQTETCFNEAEAHAPRILTYRA